MLLLHFRVFNFYIENMHQLVKTFTGSDANIILTKLVRHDTVVRVIVYPASNIGHS